MNQLLDDFQTNYTSTDELGAIEARLFKTGTSIMYLFAAGLAFLMALFAFMVLFENSFLLSILVLIVSILPPAWLLGYFFSLTHKSQKALNTHNSEQFQEAQYKTWRLLFFLSLAAVVLILMLAFLFLDFKVPYMPSEPQVMEIESNIIIPETIENSDN